MRKLKTSDIPVLCRCLKRIGVKEQVQAIAKDSDTVRDMWDKGFDLFWGIFDAATEKNGETAIYEFLAGPFEMSAEEVENLDMDILFANLQQLAADNNLAVFFKFAAKSMR